jgi:hypothetical protein
MSTESLITRPTSIEELQSVVSKWMRSSPVRTSGEIRFSRVKPTKGMKMSTRLQKGLTFEQGKDIISWTHSNRRLSLELSDFSIRTSCKNDSLIVEVHAREATPLRALSKALSTVATTKHPIFFSRALRALSEITAQLSSQGIDDLSTASTDTELLLNSLLAAPVIDTLSVSDPLAKVKLRGIEAKMKLIDKVGGTLSGRDAAGLIGLTRQAVDKRRSNNQLIGLTQGRRGYVYPAFQFEAGITLTGLETVLKTLSSHDPWMQVIFFASGNDRLGGKTPIDVLRSGDVNAVLLAATAFGEHGAA